MKLIWRHSINSVQVQEPIGWDAIKFTLQRDSQYSGLENLLSDNITFDGPGGLIIKNAYAIRGIDAALEYLVEYSCDEGLTYSTQLNAIINCVTYKEVNNEVTVKIEPSGFHRKVKNRLDVPVNLMSNTSIGGAAMSSISAFDLGMHSKGLIKQGRLKDNIFLNNIVSDVFLNNEDVICYFPLEIDISEIQSLQETTTLFALCAGCEGSADAVFINTPDPNETIAGFDVSYKLQGTLRFRPPDGQVGSYKLTGTSVYAAYGDIGTDNAMLLQNFGINVEVDLGWPNGFGAFTSYDFAIDIEGTFNIPNDVDKIFFYVILNTEIISGTPADNYVVEWIFEEDSFIEIESSSLSDPSVSQAFLLHEVFAKLSESMTDIQDSFKSDFFGRTNSSPRVYDSNGCGGWVALTNGLNIRNMLDKDGNLFPIIASFNELFEACNAVWNLGMRIEIDSNGKEFIRVEPKEYFFDQTSIITLSAVANIETTPAIDLIYNEFEAGYEKSNLNTGGINGIDEFNSKRNYSVPIEKAKKKLTAISKIIAGGYIIEQTRRIQYNANPSSDFETDNNMFFICTNIASVTSDLYTTPPVSTTYEAGTISERDENFTNIENLISPTTPYNLRISPTSIVIKWWKIIGSSMHYAATPEIKFISGTGNYQEKHEQSDSCNTYDGVVEQDQNFTSANIIGSDADNIYIPNYINFDFPISWPDFVILQNNSEKVIQFSCNGTIKRGFLKQLEFEPNAEGGIATFKLIESGGCIGGEFDPEEFSVAFNIGC